MLNPAGGAVHGFRGRRSDGHAGCGAFDAGFICRLGGVAPLRALSRLVASHGAPMVEVDSSD